MDAFVTSRTFSHHNAHHNSQQPGSPLPNTELPSRRKFIQSGIATLSALTLPRLAQAETGVHYAHDVESLHDALIHAAEGDTIKVRPGKYQLEKPLIVDKNAITLEGEGRNTVLVLKDRANCPVIFVGKNEVHPSSFIEDVVVRNLKIDGNKDAQTTEHWVPPTENGWFTNNGVTFRQCRNCKAENLLVTDTRSGGIVCALECSGIHLKGILSTYNFYDGIAFGGDVHHCLIENSKCLFNTCAGLSLDIAIHQNTFRNLVCMQNKDGGVFMRASWENIFESCSFLKNSNYGVYLADGDAVSDYKGSRKNSFLSCAFSDNGKYGYWQDGEKSLENSITDAEFRSNREYDIFPPDARVQKTIRQIES